MKTNNFLKGLDELRAIAALAVVFHHIELLKGSNIAGSWDNIPSLINSNVYLSHFTMAIGKYAVLFFFVLSGFLITHLMLQEYKKYNTFDFKSFYMRRVLRIWPLYYIIMGLTFFVIPFIGNHWGLLQEHPNSWYKLLINTDFNSLRTWFTSWSFLSNHTLYDGIVLVGGSQTWSVSIEEQFYLFWPILLLVVFKKRPILYLALTIISIILLNRYCKGNIPSSMLFFEFLFLGGIGALFYHSPQFNKIRKNIDKKLFYFVNLFIIIILSFIPIFSSYSQYVIISIFFLFFIILTVNNSYCFRSRLFSQIGKISYGVYMYHTFVMFLMFPFVKYIKINILQKTGGGNG
ncbi:MAG: acyltransferase [Flavobacteriaceae bacterium]|nr:acyltransferase [Flavobacteriaceae bacterium]